MFPKLLACCLALTGQRAGAFAPDPRPGFGTGCRNKNNNKNNNNNGALSSLLKNHEFGFKAFSSSFPTKRDPRKKKPTSQAQPSPSSPKQNDMSMFLKGDDEDTPSDAGSGGFAPLEVHAGSDESIRRLEEVEDVFRNERLYEHDPGPVGTAGRDASVAVPKPHRRHRGVAMTDRHGIGADEDCSARPKKLIYYDYEGTVSKVRRNLCHNPSGGYYD